MSIAKAPALPTAERCAGPSAGDMLGVVWFDTGRGSVGSPGTRPAAPYRRRGGLQQHIGDERVVVALLLQDLAQDSTAALSPFRAAVMQKANNASLPISCTPPFLSCSGVNLGVIPSAGTCASPMRRHSAAAVGWKIAGRRCRKATARGGKPPRRAYGPAIGCGVGACASRRTLSRSRAGGIAFAWRACPSLSAKL